MPDAVPPAVRASLDDPFARLDGPLAGTRRLGFQVTASERISPSVHSVVLTAPELDGFGYAPGQDVMLLVGTDGIRPVRRRYTIRALDRSARALDRSARALDRSARLTLNIVRHSEGPGERWVAGSAPGDTIEGIGPRGKITTRPEADWHLFIGDESAMPAIMAMTEALPGDADATLVIEVPDPADEQELLAPARTRLTWLHRLGAPAGQPDLLAGEAEQVELPSGRGQAYVFGEASVVMRIREVLAARGLPAEQVSAKAYWGRRRANAGHGEPATASR